MTSLKIQICIFLWVASFSTLLSDPEPEPPPDLCHFIDAREFNSIGLQSISWDNSDELLIFTEPQYRFYSLAIDKVEETSMDFSEAKFGSIAERDKYDRAIAYVKDQSLKATYMFRVDTNGITGQKHIILLVTDKGTLSGNFKDAAWDVVEPSGEEVPEFSLAFCSKDLEMLLGYVISSDIYGNTGYFIIGKFNLHWEDAKFIGLPTKGEQEKRPYFYLEVGDNPEEVFLVHPTVEPDPEGQLLASLPRSFMFGCQHLVLLDTANGCVHIIYDYIGPDLFAGHEDTATQKHTLKRANIPFEKYFKCGKEVQTDEKRCDVVKGTHASGGLFSNRFAQAAGASLALISVLAVFVIFYTLKLKKNKKTAQTGDSSSGTVSTTTGTMPVKGPKKGKKPKKASKTKTEKMGGTEEKVKIGLAHKNKGKKKAK